VFKEKKFKEFNNLIKTLMEFEEKYLRFHGNAQKGRRHRITYWSLYTRKCFGTDFLLEKDIKVC
jgi:hypothetical protein